MQKLYTYGMQPAMRNITVAELKNNKGKRKYTQVTADNYDEAAAAVAAGIDTLSCGLAEYERIRSAAPNHFIVTALPPTEYITEDQVLGAALKVMERGSDAVFTNRSLSVIERISQEGIPVMSHLGMSPRKSSWYGALRVLGKTAEEARIIYQQSKDLENAGAFAAEIELVAQELFNHIVKTTNLVTFSLGSGPGGDVVFLYSCDILGEEEDLPRHSKAYTNLHKLKKQMQTERIRAFKDFQSEVITGKFPDKSHTVSMPPDEKEKFLKMI